MRLLQGENAGVHMVITKETRLARNSIQHRIFKTLNSTLELDRPLVYCHITLDKEFSDSVFSWNMSCVDSSKLVAK